MKDKQNVVLIHSCQKKGIDYFVIDGNIICGHCSRPMVKKE